MVITQCVLRRVITLCSASGDNTMCSAKGDNTMCSAKGDNTAAVFEHCFEMSGVYLAAVVSCL